MASLEDVDHLNEDLLALARARVDLQLGFPATAPLADALRTAVSTVAVAVARGSRVEDAVNDPQTPLPAPYRTLLATTFRLNSAEPAIEALRRRAVALRRGRVIARHTIVYPLVVVTLAAAAIAVNASTTGPQLRAAQQAFRIPPSKSLGLLSFAQTAASPALLALGAAIFAFVALARRGVVGWNAIPGLDRLRRLVEEAHLADQACNFVRQGASVDEAVALLRSLPPLAESKPGVSCEPFSKLRPLLKWSLSASMSPGERTTALATACEAYYDLANRRARQMQILLPAIACAVVGGGAVLLQGYLAFGPWSEFLLQLSAPTIAT